MKSVVLEIFLINFGFQGYNWLTSCIIMLHVPSNIGQNAQT